MTVPSRHNWILITNRSEIRLPETLRVDDGGLAQALFLNIDTGSRIYVRASQGWKTVTPNAPGIFEAFHLSPGHTAEGEPVERSMQQITPYAWGDDVGVQRAEFWGATDHDKAYAYVVRNIAALTGTPLGDRFSRA